MNLLDNHRPSHGSHYPNCRRLNGRLAIAPSEATYAALLMDSRREQEVSKKNISVASALASAGFWDEYLLKIRELGLTKWSRPELLVSERNALMDSAKTHQLNAEKMAQSGFLDRAFDEAERAYRRNPCSAEIAIYFNSIRPQFVEPK